MSTERVIRSVARLVEVLADKISVSGLADGVFPMNAAESERRRSRLFVEGSAVTLERFPYVGVLKMNSACASILEAYSEVSCEIWEVYYGTFESPILVDSSTRVGFSCFDGNPTVMDFFCDSNEIEALSVDKVGHVLRINAKDPVNQSDIAIQFVNVPKRY
jgi:hypothetical protein